MRLAPVFVLLPALAFAQTPAPRPSTPVARPAPTTPATPAQTPPARPAARGTGPATPRPAPAAMTDEQKTIYALGLVVQRSLKPFDLNAAEMAIVMRALTDAAAGKPAV